MDRTNKKGFTPLMTTSYNGHIAVAALLLETAADPTKNLSGEAIINAQNTEGNSSLMLVAFNGHSTVVRYLIEHGAAIDSANDAGCTALLCATEKGEIATVKLLVLISV
ncbi:hypothetical protein PI124_g5253 [Phytophthora idaei]|nr:hypothetical protein PI126_g20065 [Phytophthora idaei]KAG3250141.1 hypothetical protein PI124_g5253 [Phytophthora idaei]